MTARRLYKKPNENIAWVNITANVIDVIKASNMPGLTKRLVTVNKQH